MAKSSKTLPERISWFTDLLCGQMLVVISPTNKMFVYMITSLTYIVFLMSVVLAGSIWGIYFWLALCIFLSWNYFLLYEVKLLAGWREKIDSWERQARQMADSGFKKNMFKYIRIVLPLGILFVLALLFFLLFSQA